MAVLASLVVAGFFMGFRMRRSSSPVYTDQIRVIMMMFVMMLVMIMVMMMVMML